MSWCSLPEVVIEQVNASMLDEIDARKSHDLPNLDLVVSLIALGLALFTHRFRIMRALHSHAYAISEDLAALAADRDVPFLYLSDIKLFHGKRGLLPLMMFAAVNGNETHKGADVGFFF